MARRPLVAGNWKMNGLRASIGELEEIIAGARTLPNAELMVCPPATLIASFAAAVRGSPSCAMNGLDAVSRNDSPLAMMNNATRKKE